MPVIFLLMLMACTPRVQIAQVIIGDADVGSSGGEVQVEGPLIDAEIAVLVHAPPEGLLLANTSEDRRAYEYLPFPPAPEGLTDVERLAFYEEFYAGLAETRGTNYVLQVVDVGSTLSAALQRHLRRHFRSARVELTQDLGPAADGGFVVSVQGRARMFFTKSATIELLTRSGPTNLPPIEGGAERHTGRHLGWAIPVVLIGGFLVGALIVSPIVGAIARRHVREAWANAFDEAAARWAAGVADAWRRQDGFAPAPRVAPAAIADGVDGRASTGVPPAPVACDANGTCGTGFICHGGMCLSACNPVCAANEVCVGTGECVSACNPPCGAGTVCTALRECVVQ